MNKIDIETWYRREQFELFKTFNHPHFNLCANVELGNFMPYIKDQGLSFTVAFVYAISCAANAIPEFRLRMRGDDIVEHDFISPSFTILAENDLFGFCVIDFSRDFADFAKRAALLIAQAKARPSLVDPAGRDDLLYMTAIPWVSFTGFTHPMSQHPADSIPRFAWGKYFQENEKTKIPLSVQAHHALMDGLHMARFYMLMEEYMLQPERILAGE